MTTYTLAFLNALVMRLNRAAGTPTEPYKAGSMPLEANVGNFHVSRANGGYCLQQMAQGGGASDPLYMGYVSKREFVDRVAAFIKGIEYAQTKGQA